MSWVDDTFTGFGSVTWTALTATHTNRREWSCRADFDAARERARAAGRATFEQILSMLDAGMLPSADDPVFVLPLGPLVDRAVLSGVGASSGSHGTDFAPGVRVAWISGVGVLNMGRVRRVQTLWADRSLVHVDHVDRGPRVDRGRLLEALRAMPMRPAQAVLSADRTVLSADQLFRVAEGADPFGWQDSLRTGDGWDVVAVREFVVGRLAHLTG